MVATSHGPITRRAGFCFMGSSTATQATLFGYKYKAKGFMLAISDTPEMQIWDITNHFLPVLDQTITTPWLVDQIYSLQGEQVPGEEKMFFVQRGHPPQELIFDPAAAVGSQWSLQAITFTGEPTDWGVNNYPGAMAFFQGRFWLGGTNDQPEQMWGSVSGDFDNLSLGAGALDFTISKRGQIRWFGPAQNLLVGTDQGEHVLLADQGVILTTDATIQQQSAYGSFDTNSQLIGNIVLYVSPDGRKLRDVGYRWEENNWLSRDITFMSEHISRNNQMRTVTWAQHPDNLIWAVTSPGNAVACTYERHYDVIGWHNHITQGSYEALEAIDIAGTSRLMAAFKRADGQIYYELADVERTDHPPIYLDSHVEIDSPGFTVTVPHLANQTVGVTIDYATHPDITLDGAGQGTLQYTGEDVHIGLNFTSRVRSLPLDYTPEEQGTSQHFKKRWNKIFVRLLESARPLINGKRPGDRTPSTPMGTPEPIRTEDIQVTDLGWDTYAQIEIEQSLPLPLTIAGIFGEAGQKQL